MMNQKEENGKLDWMCKGANSLIDREEYLLGKSVDKSLEQLNKEDKDKRVGIVAPNNHVEHECIPPSIRDFNKIVQAEQVDLSAKLQEDPLVAIRKQEEEARRQFLQNPVQLKKLQDALKSQELKKKNKKIKKSKKSKVDLDTQLLNLLRNGQVPMRLPEIQGKRKKSGDLDTILIHKLSMFRDKLSQKEVDDIIAGKLSDDEETKKEKLSDSESDNKKTHRNLMSKKRNIKNEKESKYNQNSISENENRKGSTKYISKRKQSSSSEESDEYDRKKSKSGRDPVSRRSRRSRSSSREDKNRGKDRSKYTHKRTQSNSSEERDYYQKKKSQSSREPPSKRNVGNSSRERVEERDTKKSYSKDTRKRRTQSSSSEDSDNYKGSKGKSSDHQIKKNHRSTNSSVDRSRRKNVNKVSSKYRRSPSSTSEESEEYDQKKGKKSIDSRNKNTRDSSEERSKRKDNRNKHSEDGKNEDREKKYGQNESSKNLDKPFESRKSDLDHLISEKLRMLRNSLPEHSENTLKENSDDESLQYDSENDKYVAKKKNFGLVRPDGTKIPLKGKSHENKTNEPTKKSETQKKPEMKKMKRLTEKEKEKLRKQMMADATEREAERSENLKRYRREDEKEQQISGDFDKNFVHKELLKTTNDATVETRLKSNLNNIQRSAQHMNSNFSRRARSPKRLSRGRKEIGAMKSYVTSNFESYFIPAARQSFLPAIGKAMHGPAALGMFSLMRHHTACKNARETLERFRASCSARKMEQTGPEQTNS